MTVVSFHDFVPPARYDDVAWSEVRIEEAVDPLLGPWTQIDSIPLIPADPDPAMPTARSFTTQLGTAPNLWYRVIFADSLTGTTIPTAPVQDSLTGEPFVTTSELARILKIRDVKPEQQIAMERVLAVSAGEIRQEIDLADDDLLEGWELQLCASVNLDRAADLWRHTESIPGVSGMLDDAPIASPGYTRYSWERYAQRLAPVKRQWGFA